jgi:hypothetical protein
MSIAGVAAYRSIGVVLVLSNSYPNTICPVLFGDGADDYTKALQVTLEMLLRAARYLIRVLSMPAAISRSLGWVLLQTQRDGYIRSVTDIER